MPIAEPHNQLTIKPLLQILMDSLTMTTNIYTEQANRVYYSIAKESNHPKMQLLKLLYAIITHK